MIKIKFKRLKKIPKALTERLIKCVYYINPWKYKFMYVNFLKKRGVSFKGMPQFISHTAHFDGSDYSLIKIGDKSTISMNVLLLTHDQSPLVGFRMTGQDGYGFRYGEIHIGDNTFIGANSILLPGTYLGDNTIVGAGSVVKGKFPDGVIIAGNPARVITDTLEQHYINVEKSDDYKKVINVN